VAPRRASSLAEKLFVEGQHFMAQRDIAAACPKFAESRALEDGLGVRLWLADCLEQNGQSASAWTEFVATAELARQRDDPRQAVARARAEALFPRLSRVVLVSPPALDSRVRVECDRVPIPRSRWTTGHFVDPGLHHLQAVDGLEGDPGAPPPRAYWETDLEVGPSSAVAEVAFPAPPGTLLRTVPLGLLTPEVASTAGRGTGTKIAAATTAGLGLVALSLGVYFGVEAINNNDAGGPCGQYCSATAHDLRLDALHDATAADIAIGIGAAAVIGGVLLFVLGKKGREPPSSRTSTLVLLAGPMTF
jgi:hypothetical protein